MFNYELRECDILEHLVGVGARLHPPLNLLYGIKDVPSEAGRLRAEPISFRRPRRAELTLFAPLSSSLPPLSDDGNGIGLRKGCKIELIKAAARPPVAGFVGDTSRCVFTIVVSIDKLNARDILVRRGEG